MCRGAGAGGIYFMFTSLRDICCVNIYIISINNLLRNAFRTLLYLYSLSV